MLGSIPLTQWGFAFAKRFASCVNGRAMAGSGPASDRVGILLRVLPVFGYFRSMPGVRGDANH